MFRSVRARLIVSYAAIIFLCLLLAGSAFVFLLREYQYRIKIDQLGNLAFAISYQVRLLERVGAQPGQIGAFLRDQAQETDVRILLTDRTGRVIDETDPGGGLIGTQADVPGRERPSRVWAAYYYKRASDGYIFVVAVPQLTPFGEAILARPSAYNVILAVPEHDISSAWRELAPILIIAGGASLVVSILVAFFVSRSISRPIARITAASEAMARGDYEQFIATTGRDEVGRLARTFNQMAAQVAASHQTLRDFLANVSHELKTPLTSIQGFSQAMVDGALATPEEYRAAGAIVNEEATRMHRMVEDLLFLSKIESGQIGRRDEVVDLEAVLRAAARRVSWQLEQNGQDLDLRVELRAGVLGDAHWLGQLFSNLVDNAVRHTPAGGAIAVVARLEPRGPHAGARVVVHNTGSYIPADDQGRVFERFYQVDKSRRGEGTGLGLAIVKEIAQVHGGDVGVYSDPESGTSFGVWLPAVPLPMPPMSARDPATGTEQLARR